MNIANVRTLLVDDDPAMLRIVSKWLEKGDFSVETAVDGEQALDRIKAETFDVVITDWEMPRMDGLELCRAIRRLDLPRYVYVVFLTNRSSHGELIEAMEAGADDFLIKPIQQAELLARMQAGSRVLNRERKLEHQAAVIRSAHEETIYRLATAASCRDQETGQHIRRTGLCSAVLARAVGWSAEDVQWIRMAAPMHDLGKVGIPDAILQKPGKLTPEEFRVMETHATIGAKILGGSDTPMLQMAEEIALSHHERWDGSGYPAGLAGEDIPESARIVAIIDVYDALTHDRVYRPAFSEDETLEMMRKGIGTHFDPSLLAIFFTVHDEIRDIAVENSDEQCEADLPGQSLDLCRFQPLPASGPSVPVPRP
ncbi:MAG TPA: HD domain-containing phosphohydrolase [Thermoguttaceae bacterium]|nr:HD domain-containing phosphohydrolase [Thermoguttaceae bacterium]